MTDLEREIRTLVSNYVAGQLTFGQFNLAVAEGTWDVPQTDLGAQHFAYDVELLVAEFTSGHRTEASLRRALSERLGGVFFIDATTLVSIVFQSPPTTTGAIMWGVTPRPHVTVLPARIQAQASNAVRYLAASA
jgi:hypothetical protein